MHRPVNNWNQNLM